MGNRKSHAVFVLRNLTEKGIRLRIFIMDFYVTGLKSQVSCPHRAEEVFHGKATGEDGE